MCDGHAMQTGASVAAGILVTGTVGVFFSGGASFFTGLAAAPIVGLIAYGNASSACRDAYHWCQELCPEAPCEPE